MVRLPRWGRIDGYERINVIFKYAPSTFPGKLTEVIGKLESIGDVVDEALAELWRIRS
jgi:hypothetical protein